MKNICKNFFILTLIAAMTVLPSASVLAASSPYPTIRIKGSSLYGTGSYYYGNITGTGVRFRSSPKISSTNIIKTFTDGEAIGVYQSDINCAYADGYWWSYVECKGQYGYVASIYFTTDGIE